MPLFHYPKSQHKRTYAPRAFKSYRSYKRYVQREFARLCVYCRSPDTQSRESFGVDHYRPKSLFPALEREYSNLFYCCGPCNSRKNAYWPLDETTGAFVVNPCDYAMADHLRLDAATCRINAKSKHGQRTADLLQLNDDDLVSYRELFLHTLDRFESEVQDLGAQRKALQKQWNKKLISDADYTLELASIDHDIARNRRRIERLLGQSPLPPLKPSRFGLTMGV